MRRLADHDRGSAVVEFVFVAVLVMVPLIYLIVSVAVIQRSRLAVTNAARDVGRALASGHSDGGAQDEAAAALRIAVTNQGLSAGDVELRYVAADSSCDSPAIAPSLQSGSDFAVCVTHRQRLPAIPSILAASAIRTVGRFVVHIDDYAVVAP